MRSTGSGRIRGEVFSCAVDEFGTQAAATTGIPSVAQGVAIHVSGWVADADRGILPRRVFGLIDDSRMVHPMAITRHDVAKHLGSRDLAECGFDMTIDTTDLVPKQHLLSIVAEDADASLYRVEQRLFRVVEPPEAPRAFPRVIVSGAPKSGSTYTWLVLTKYFGTEELTPGALYRGTQPLLEDWVLQRLRNRTYVAHMHLFPNDRNLRAMATESIVPVVLRRNLGDTIVSNDEHFRKLHDVAPNAESEKYFQMAAQERYRFLIRFRLAEYISFYLGWRHAGVPIFRFEGLATDEAAFFERIITHVAGTVDRGQLHAAQVSAGEESARRKNRNRGAIGRSAELFDDTTKALLEEMLAHYYEPLHELMSELPWRSEKAKAPEA
jgi:hypothetical protein